MAQFPTPFDIAFPLEPAGPPYLLLQDIPPQYFGTEVEFKDGGATYALPNTAAILRFDFTYNGLVQGWVAFLDNHYAAHHGNADPFTFRHPRTGVLYSDVHYELFEYPPHEKVYCQSRHIVLIKRPTG